MLERCIDTGLNPNPDKCFVKQDKIRFYGVVCSQDGVQPDPHKVSALKEISPYKLSAAPNLPRPRCSTHTRWQTSKALTDVEERYPNIERELQAVVYGCEKFKTYLCGGSCTVHTDHKPLKSIHLKHLTAAPPRLQQMLLRLQPYDLTIHYQPGKNMEIADALSQLSPEGQNPIPDMNVQIHEVFPQFSNNMLQLIKDQTRLNPELSALKGMIHTGWPTNIQQVPMTLKPFWPFRDELATEDGILMKAHQIIITVTLQEEMLMKLHSPHLGTEETKLRGRSSVYWRGFYKDIQETTKSCSTCEELLNNQQKEPLMPTEIPPRAWHTISTDLSTLDSSDDLVIGDYYSQFPVR
ncbi:Retrovirus-related Pol polyprotein [Stylophora pistillata]|uniref:Retrovirus-related Pol polyprotein n=1 Tax=Stylophora pistillata TaxID=50429 RepID=A0A2B4SND2_STYPI|nr:Retrovirus-related Pol polyprotein [Stylophora pistillata]